MIIDCNNIPNIQFGDTPYYFNGKPVPRVTHILSSMLHEEYLMDWAEKMGRIKQNRNVILQNAADIGNEVHGMCENFLRYRMVPIFKNIPGSYSRNSKQCKIRNAFEGFMMWINNLDNNCIWKPLMMEVPLINELYGGTLDALIEIDGKIYIVDFKTSNQMSYKYILQVIAYRKTLKDIYGINTDGCIVLRLEKYKKCFPEELVLDLTKPDVLEFAGYCENMFMSLVYSYYNRMIVENYYKYCTGGKRL